MSQKELFLQQQKEVKKYQNSPNFQIDNYFDLIMKYIKEGNCLLIDEAVDFLINFYKQMNDTIYLKACFALVNQDILFYELMSFEEQVKFELAKIKALTYYGCYVNEKFIKDARHSIKEYTYLVDDGKELYYQALIYKHEVNDPDNEQRYLNDLNSYYLLGNDISVDEARELGINSDIYYLDVSSLKKMLSSADEENKKAILRQLVHLGDIDSIDKLNEIDPLFNYDLFMYSKYPNGLKKKNERKEVERKESNKKDKQVPPETKVNPVKTTKVPENKPPYKNKFISFAKTIFLVPVLLYILSQFLIIPYINEILETFVGGHYLEDYELGQFIAMLVLAFLPFLYIMISNIRTYKNQIEQKQATLFGRIMLTIFMSLMFSICTNIIFGFMEGDVMELIDFSDIEVWISAYGIRIISVFIANLIICFGNFLLDRCRKSSVWTTIISTIVYAALALGVIFVMIEF